MEIVDFRFLTKEDSYDNKYINWSRTYEYKYVLDNLEKLGGNKYSKIHNTAWGYNDLHSLFKDDLTELYPNSIHSDILDKSTSLFNTAKQDLTKEPENRYLNYFDFVLNIGLLQEKNKENILIIKNLLKQVKLNGYLILTFDLCSSGNSANLKELKNFLKSDIKNEGEILNQKNSVIPWDYEININIGVLIIKKIEVRKKLQGNSEEHLDFFLEKLEKKEPFSLIRPNDGEFKILKNDKFTNIDNWTFNGGILRDDLAFAIQKASILESSYIGIPCKSCWKEENTQWYIENFNIDSSHLTYGNVVCNKNWKKFVNYFKDNNVEFYYIGPGKVENDFKVLDRFYIDEKQVNRYEEERTTLLENLRLWVESKINPIKTSIFLFSAGPLSKIFIPNLFEIYPNNIYIDCGSSLDLDFKGISNREYIIDTTKYKNIICDFKQGHPPSPDITCILNVYKRPHCLKEQLEAVLNQTLPPKKIIIYKNYAEGVLTLPNDVLELAFKNNITIINSSENFGVWARFAVALLAKTTYVCIFDDDTIPGKKWFENCYATMLKVNGLLGTIGVIFQPSPDKYIMKNRFGWGNPNEEITQVDIVGHSWFFKREWLAYLWSNVPDYEFMDVSGEDMGFSYALQKVGINTYVPPHPENDLEMYGSIPDKAWKYGMEPHCVSFTSWSKFDKMYKFYKDKGFKCLEEK